MVAVHPPMEQRLGLASYRTMKRAPSVAASPGRLQPCRGSEQRQGEAEHDCTDAERHVVVHAVSVTRTARTVNAQ